MAQLGERCLRKAEATGSNPVISTKAEKAPERVLFLRTAEAGWRSHPCESGKFLDLKTVCKAGGFFFQPAQQFAKQTARAGFFRYSANSGSRVAQPPLRERKIPRFKNRLQSRRFFLPTGAAKQKMTPAIFCEGDSNLHSKLREPEIPRFCEADCESRILPIFKR
jgi:hypothetical protein